MDISHITHKYILSLSANRSFISFRQILRKNEWNKVSGIWSHLYILVVNDMWVEWVGGMWGFFTIYDNYEPGLGFTDGPKWKNGTPSGQREYYTHTLTQTPSHTYKACTHTHYIQTHSRMHTWHTHTHTKMRTCTHFEL